MWSEGREERSRGEKKISADSSLCLWVCGPSPLPPPRPYQFPCLPIQMHWILEWLSLWPHWPTHQSTGRFMKTFLMYRLACLYNIPRRSMDSCWPDWGLLKQSQMTKWQSCLLSMGQPVDFSERKPISHDLKPSVLPTLTVYRVYSSVRNLPHCWEESAITTLL